MKIGLPMVEGVRKAAWTGSPHTRGSLLKCCSQLYAAAGTLAKMTAVTIRSTWFQVRTCVAINRNSVIYVRYVYVPSTRSYDPQKLIDGRMEVIVARMYTKPKIS